MVYVVANFGELDSVLETEGTFTCRIDTSKTEVRESKNKNRMLTNVKFIVEEGDEEGSMLNEMFMLEGRGAFKIRNLLKALGEDVSDPEYQLDTNAFDGKLVQVQVVRQVDEYGEKYQAMNFLPVEEGSTDDITIG